MNRTIVVLSAILVGICIFLGVGHTQVVFQDDFNTENGGAAALNYFGLANWTVSNGTVDLIGNGFEDFYGGNGLYVDLDGSTFDAAVLTSTSIALSPGTYILNFDLGINGTGNESMTVSLGSAFLETFETSDAGFPPTFALISRQVQVTTSGSFQLVFDHAVGDNNGLIIDNVSLTRVVPEPVSVTLLAACLICLLQGRRQK